MIRQAPEAPPSPPAEAAEAVPLLPPRPNLGPEPWREGPGGIGPWLVAVTALLLVGLIAFGVRLGRRRRASRRPRPSPNPGRHAASDGRSSAEQVVARAEALREALIAAFGPSWGARTTEEVADSPELADRIGPDRAARVVSILAEADRAKFAGSAPPGDQGEPEEADRWVAEVSRALSSKAGASSTSNGR